MADNRISTGTIPGPLSLLPDGMPEPDGAVGEDVDLMDLGNRGIPCASDFAEIQNIRKTRRSEVTR